MAVGGNKRFAAIGKKGGRATHFHLKADPVVSPVGLTHLTNVIALGRSQSARRHETRSGRAGRHTLAWALAANEVWQHFGQQPDEADCGGTLQSPALPVVERGLVGSRDRKKRDLRESERTHPASISAEPGASGVERSNLL